MTDCLLIIDLHPSLFEYTYFKFHQNLSWFHLNETNGATQDWRFSIFIRSFPLFTYSSWFLWDHGYIDNSLVP
jgi:hypothetical protein